MVNSSEGRGLAGRNVHQSLPTEHSIQLIHFLFSLKSNCDVCRKKVSAIPGHVNFGSITKMLCYVKSPSLSLLACEIGLWGYCDACTAKDNEAKSFFAETKCLWSLIECLTAQLLLVLLFLYVCVLSMLCVHRPEESVRYPPLSFATLTVFG